MHRRLLLLLPLLVWLCSAVYVVEPDQVGIVRRCGRLVDELAQPGLHVDLPWPLARIERVRRDETRQVSVGLAAAGEQIRVLSSEERQSEFLTGDQNLIHVQATLHFRVADPVGFALGQQSPEAALAFALESALTETIASIGVDALLTSGRSDAQRRVLERAAALGEQYGLGVAVLSVDLASVRPPVLVQREFQDAIAARNDRERFIHDALSRKVELAALAKGEQRRILNQAEADKQQFVERAKGDAAYFTSLVEEFERPTDPAARQRVRSLTLERLWLESVSRILARVKEKLFVDPGEKVDVILPGKT
jgi:membrane protease subunit HflK